MASSARIRSLLTYLPVLACAIVMIPRVINAQFGLFDDARTISVARSVMAGDWSGIWEPGSARSRPVYWLFNSLIYAFAGPRPELFYLSNAAVFAVTTGSLTWFALKTSGSRLQACLAGLLFALSAPAVETFYTLSKPEVAQVLWLVLSGVAGYALGSATRWPGRLVAGAAVVVTLLLADMTKEPSLGVIPISMVGTIAAWLIQGRRSTGKVASSIAAYSAAALAAGLVYLFLRARFATLGLPAGTYGAKYSLDPTAFRASLLRWAGWLARDFSYLGPVALLWPIIGSRLTRGAHILLGLALIWMGGWVGLYIPWMYASEYYLLPFAMGAALFAGVLGGRAIIALMSPGGVRVVASWIAVLLTAAGILVSLANAGSDAGIQMTVDRENSALLDFLSAQLPQAGTVVINIQDPNEYEVEITMQLAELRSRPDLKVDYYHGQPQALDSGVYLVSAAILNQPLLTVRMGVVEPTIEHWNESLLRATDGRAQSVYAHLSDFRLAMVNLPTAFCSMIPRTDYCESREPLVDTRVFEYGWTVYRMSSQVADPG